MSTTLSDGAEFFVTPRDPDLSSIVAELVGYSKKSVRFMCYAFVDNTIYEALQSVITAGVDTQGIIDHTQSTGPTEAKALQSFFMHFPRKNVYIGTSPVSDQIIHSKSLWINYSDSTQPIEPSTFTNWRDAAKSGVPVGIFGSWNFSPSANHQINTSLITFNSDIIRSLQETYETLVQWNIQHHPQWNTGEFSMDKLAII